MPFTFINNIQIIIELDDIPDLATRFGKFSAIGDAWDIHWSSQKFVIEMSNEDIVEAQKINPFIDGYFTFFKPNSDYEKGTMEYKEQVMENFLKLKEREADPDQTDWDFLKIKLVAEMCRRDENQKNRFIKVESEGLSGIESDIEPLELKELLNSQVQDLFEQLQGFGFNTEGFNENVKKAFSECKMIQEVRKNDLSGYMPGM